MMAKSAIIWTEETKPTQAGCDSFAARAIRRSKIWWCFSTMAVCTTEPLGKFFLDRNSSSGTTPGTPSLWESLWRLVTLAAEVSSHKDGARTDNKSTTKRWIPLFVCFLLKERER